ncbi:hypothetical protein A2Z22_04940 [Candidatus Woesebacteria bacterium RBG_16_34_12]|uniref:Four helix bundle protein n=1 Tax=Candidatus Woesebacteria bacterium RBG_16_34_12 TaxID=1802480 RepID=A0A1F7XB56_9BACT|nr:MAG: hypothetical protein A2Z22_04940 [Candidatus Woesebacteria bacterium RBG_16_34_12]
MEFYELKIWKKGHKLLIDIYEITKSFPKEEKYNLISQTRSSANSIIALIAESYGRYSFADKVRVLYQSRGECVEVRSHLKVAYSLGYLTKKKFDYFEKEYLGLGKGINSYITSLSKHKSSK